MSILPVYAFRCKKCGHLHRGEHAGENLIPHACVVCGSGVVYSPIARQLAAEITQHGLRPERKAEIIQQLSSLGAEAKQLDPDNWEVLADATPARLKELGLEKSQVEKYTPKVVTDPKLSKFVFVGIGEGVGTVETSTAKKN